MLIVVKNHDRFVWMHGKSDRKSGQEAVKSGTVFLKSLRVRSSSS